jgi:predicted phosphodiesterase
LLYGIFSDPHSNLEGLQAALEECRKAGAEKLVCCGDIVGYNADPAACVDLVRGNNVICIRGNHERGLQDLKNGLLPPMNAYALEAIRYSYEKLDEERRSWLVSLPDELLVDGIFYVFHGSPFHPDEYIFELVEAAYAFRALVNDYPPPGNSLCFIGHTHVCAAYAFDPEGRKVQGSEVAEDTTYLLKPGYHYMFNAGSCGQYRGGKPVSSLVLFDSDHMTVSFRLLPYDVEKAQRKVLESGLPPFLALRLGQGR